MISPLENIADRPRKPNETEKATTDQAMMFLLEN
jgi:hypothetical protein